MTLNGHRKSLRLLVSCLVIAGWSIFLDKQVLEVVLDGSILRNAKSAHSFDAVSSTQTQKQPLGTLLTGVMVEIRCHKALLITLQQAIRHFRDQEIRLVVWHSSHNRHFLEQLIEADPTLNSGRHNKLLSLYEFSPLDYGFNESFDHQQVRYAGAYWYQRLIKSTTFWESIPTAYMINLQTDGLVCRPLSLKDSFVSRLQNGPTINYLGGISGSVTFFDANSGNKTFGSRPVPQIPSASKMSADFSLNGGFSLHSVPWTLNCIKQYQMPPWVDKYSEDQLWNFCRSQNGWNITELDAYSFASNLGRTMCFADPTGKAEQICPFGVHKPWKKGAFLRSYTLLQRECPGLQLLHRLQGFFANAITCNVRGMVGTLSIPCQCS